MNYHTLGRTGLKVSEIGMGCEGLVDKSYDQVQEFVDKMEALGVNCIDLYSPNPEMRSNLGRA
ncbi:MAG: aldo/keto reductase, partial [Lawsonibacter sp.]|nr:aldo/keto reductase [Lawsonibacter sp.]